MAKRTTLLLVLLLLITSCQGTSSTNDVSLEAAPARTRASINTPPAPSKATQSTVIMLDGVVRDYLAVVDDTPILERQAAFSTLAAETLAPCMNPQRQTIDEAMAALDINLISQDGTDWRNGMDEFSASAFTETAITTLEQLSATLPDLAPVTLCFIPLPTSLLMSLPLSITVLPNTRISLTAPQTAIVGLECATPACALSVTPAVIRAVTYLQQTSVLNTDYSRFTILEYVVTEGRADVLTQALAPDTALIWYQDLPIEQEVRAWLVMVNQLHAFASDYTRWYPYSRGSNSQWQALTVGLHLVQDFQAAYPDVTLADIMTVAPQDILAGSGYAERMAAADASIDWDAVRATTTAR